MNDRRFNILLIILPTLITILLTSSIGAQVFTFGDRYSTESFPECIVTGNFNGDSYTDIAVSHSDTDLVLIYINDGNAGFSQSYSLDISRESGLHSEDFNGDGLDDLASYDTGRLPPYGWGTTVRLNNGDGTFELIFQDTLGSGWEYMCTGDFDGDSNIDIAIYQWYDGTGIWMYIGNGDGTFENPVLVQSFPSDMWLDAADVNNDGDLDIVCASGSETFSLINEGSGQFAEPILAGGTMYPMAIANLNGDAFPDLIGTGIYGCSGVPHYMIGIGNGTFGVETRAWLTAGVLLKDFVMSADFNSDGFGDIALCSFDMNSVMVGINNGRMSFDNIEYINEVDIAGGIYMVAGDFDNDGDFDLAITGRDDTLSVALSLGAQHIRRIYVPEDFPTIQEAVNYAWNLDTIIVGPGIYYENIDFGGKNIVMMSSDYLDESKYSNLSTDLKNSATTIIDGGGTNRVFTFDDFEDSRSIVAGFTIQNGYTDGYGGGIYLYDTASPTITHNIIKDNIGGAGGGIFVNKSTGSIKNNLIVGNSATLWGGGIYSIASEVSIYNNTIYGNSAVDGGGGLYFNYGSPTLWNNIFWANSSTINGQEIDYPTDPPLITYSVIQGGFPGEGNISEDPMFVDPENGDFNLLVGSPCINAGDPNSPTDPDGTVADIGTYCYLDPLDIDNGDNVPELPFSFTLSQNYPNPFNPLTTIEYTLAERAFVKIGIFNVLGQHVNTLVNVEQPVGNYRFTWNGRDENGRSVTSGVYFYRISTDKFTSSKKMLLLK